MEPLSLTLFGDVKLKRGPNGDIALPRKTQMLLAYLASDAEKRFPRNKLASLIWVDRSEEQARHSLRQCLFALAKSIGGAATSPVVADRHQVSLNPDIVGVDTWRFERLLAEGTPEAMRNAVALYEDDYLAGVGFEDETLDAWCAAERTRLRDRFYDTLAKLASHYADTANLDRAIETGRRLTNLDPLREDGHRTLMRLYSRAGRRAEAINQYRLCFETLRRELNVEPEAPTTKLFEEVRRQPETGAGQDDISIAPSDPATADGSPSAFEILASGRGSKTLVTGLGVIIGIVVVVLWLTNI